MLRRNCVRGARFVVTTPFDHQPYTIPSSPTYHTVMDAVLPRTSVPATRKEELRRLLRGLPEQCDLAKERYGQAQRACQYYRARFTTGVQAQQRQMGAVARMNSDAEVQAWARSRCHRIHNPLEP